MWKNGKQVIGALSGYKDDICDATAAVLYECNANSAMLNVLPKPRLAYTGTRFRSSTPKYRINSHERKSS